MNTSAFNNMASCEQQFTLNDAKEALYKENPKAILKFIHNGVAHYRAKIPSLAVELWFDVPFTDMGEGRFYAEENSKHLIRWINFNE
jgi:hypothetical protein